MLHAIPSEKSVGGFESRNHQTSMDFTKDRTAIQVHNITNVLTKKPVFHMSESEIGGKYFHIMVSYLNSSYLIKGTFSKGKILDFYERNTQDDTYIYKDVHFDTFSYCNGSYTQIAQDKIPKIILDEIKRNNYILFSSLPNAQ